MIEEGDSTAGDVKRVESLEKNWWMSVSVAFGSSL